MKNKRTEVFYTVIFALSVMLGVVAIYNILALMTGCFT